MAADMILYSYYRSSASYRARIILNLKQLEYDIKPVHLLEGGGHQHQAEYKALNPMSQVPTLVHKGRPISQSLAILEYLEDLYTETSLYPRDSFIKAKCLQFLEIINSGIQPIQNLSVLQKLEADFAASAEQKRAWIQHWVHKGLASLEAILEETSGTYCFGGEITAADAFLVPQVFSGIRFGATTDNYPILDRIYKSCMDLEAFKNAAPENQPDTPK